MKRRDKYMPANKEQKPNILIVDDVSANLVLLSEIIKSAGYVPRPVISVKQALAAINQKSPHIILLDITMPEINGFDFCSMLKADVKTRDIPIIFISALDSVEDKIKGFKLGAVDYIAKPFEKEEVTLRLDTHLKIYKMQQELETYNKKLHKVVNTQIRMVAEEQNNIFYALASLLESRYGNGDGHLGMIGANCRILAMSLQFSPKFDKKITSSFIDTIEVASQLHDIGTFAIRDNILLKEGTLTPEEWEIVKKHSETGAKHLEKIYKYSGNNELVDMAVDIARYHHENWDGTGYPYGLSGDEIPLSARIMAIVDVYDALNRDRCYRKAYSNEESLEIMKNETGKRFDPHMMEIFNKVHKQMRLS